MKTLVCALCVRPVPRRWWQVGPLRPLPVCPSYRAAGCRLFTWIRVTEDLRTVYGLPDRT